jgi:hypothetical protein
MECEDLDLQSIAATCERLEEHFIPKKQLKLLQSALLKKKTKKKTCISKM